MAQDAAQSSQEQLIQRSQEDVFIHLQNLNVKMINLKHNIDNVLIPSLNHLNHQIQFANLNNWYITNQQQYLSLFQNQINISQEIETSNFQYKQYEQYLKHLQSVYHKQNECKKMWNILNYLKSKNQIISDDFVWTFTNHQNDENQSESANYYMKESKLIINGLLYDNILNLLYFLGNGVIYKYDIIRNIYKSFKCPQPLFSSSIFEFLPGSNNNKIIVCDSNSFKYDYLYIYNILNNKIEFKTIIKLPKRINLIKYEMTIASILQNHNTLSQMQFIYVIDNLYNQYYQNDTNISMDIIKILAMYYYNVHCHIVGGQYYITYNISSIYNCMDSINIEKNNNNNRYLWYNSMSFGKYANDLIKQECKIKIIFKSSIPNNFRIFMINNKFLYIIGDYSYCVDINELKYISFNIPNKLNNFQCLNVENDYFIILGGNAQENIYYFKIENNKNNKNKLKWILSAINLPNKNNNYIGCYVSKTKMIHIFEKQTGIHYSMSLKSVISNMPYCKLNAILASQ